MGEVSGPIPINDSNIEPADLKSEAKSLARAEFTYQPQAAPGSPSNSRSILGPAVRLFATFITLGVSEDIHRNIKKVLVATLSKVLTYEQLTKTELHQFIKEFKNDDHFKKATRLTVNVGSDATLDGMLIKPKSSGESEKYVIWLNGLGGRYETKLEDTSRYADDAQANILIFNYRGCGNSTSNGPIQPKDLITDTMAMIAYLTEVKGVKPEDIVVHGFSLGGGVGAAAADQAGTRHINDRSYSVFSKAAKEMVGAYLTEKVGKTAANVISSFIAVLIKGYGLDLNTEKSYQAGLKDTLILHHPHDENINKSSLKNSLEKPGENARILTNHKFVDLNKRNMGKKDDIHNTFFMDFGELEVVEGQSDQGIRETTLKVVEFIHNGKPFTEIHPQPVFLAKTQRIDLNENADLVNFLDFEGASTSAEQEGVLNFTEKSPINDYLDELDAFLDSHPVEDQASSEKSPINDYLDELDAFLDSHPVEDQAKKPRVIPDLKDKPIDGEEI
jgi:hypothetical protein